MPTKEGDLDALMKKAPRRPAIPHVHTFTDGQLQGLKQLAWQRSAPKRQFGVANRRVDSGRSDLAVDLVGIKAELACCIYFDAEFNQRTDLGGTGPVDFEKNGWTVQVSATVHATGRFILKTRAEFAADFAVLCIDRPDGTAIMGFLERHDFEDHFYTKNLGHGVFNLCVDQRWLRPVEELRAILDLDRTEPRPEAPKQAVLFA